MSEGSHRTQKEALGTWEMEVQMAVCILTKVLGTGLGSSSRAVHALNAWDISAVPPLNSLKT